MALGHSPLNAWALPRVYDRHSRHSCCRTIPSTIKPPAIPFYLLLIDRGDSDIAKLIIGLCGVQEQAGRKNLPAQNRAWVKSDGRHLLDGFKLETFDLATAVLFRSRSLKAESQMYAVASSLMVSAGPMNEERIEPKSYDNTPRF
jgi:hypothetical protein